MDKKKEDTTTTTITVTLRVQHVKPGESIHYPFTYFKQLPEDIDWVDWGVCEHKHDFWIGERGSVDGEDILRLSSFDIAERRDEEYPEWGDEEVFVSVSPSGDGGGIKWRLLNKNELGEIMEKYKDFPQFRTN